MKIPSIVRIILLLALALGFVSSAVLASETNGTIIGGGNSGYAWSNQAGWVNFGCTNCGISITDSGITGHAWSDNYGWINMAPSQGGVLVAANGALSGYAWGEGLGWVNFSGVSINSSGKFTGQATGTLIGTLTFNCTNCDVRTDYRASDFRATPTLTPPPPPSGGGGGGGGGFVFQLTPSPVPTQTPPSEAPIGTEIPGIEIGPPGEGAEIPEEGVPTAGIASEENPPLFDVEISPGPSEYKSSRTLFFVAIAIVIAAVIVFFILRRRRKKQQ